MWQFLGLSLRTHWHMINPEDRNLQSCWQVYSYENVYRICSTQRPQQIDPHAVGYAHLTWLVWKGSSAKWLCVWLCLCASRYPKYFKQTGSLSLSLEVKKVVWKVTFWEEKLLSHCTPLLSLNPLTPVKVPANQILPLHRAHINTSHYSCCLPLKKKLMLRVKAIT